MLLTVATVSPAATAHATSPEGGGTHGVTVNVTPSDGLATTMTANRTFTPAPSASTIDCLSTPCAVQVTDALDRFARHHLSCLGPPTVSTSAATDVTTVAALLNGAVNPHGVATDAWFEYSTDPTLAGAVATAPQPIGAVRS